MKLKKPVLTTVLLTGLVAGTLSARAADEKHADHGNANAKPYPLKTCIVSGEQIGSGGMKPHVFTKDGQEVKLCCKSCLKDFDKEPAKYMKKIEEEAKKQK